MKIETSNDFRQGPLKSKAALTVCIAIAFSKSLPLEATGTTALVL
jgi:hypothetical protein